MEIGDIFTVNKADREGADRLAAELSLMLEMKKSPQAWNPPIVKTVATREAEWPNCARGFLNTENFSWREVD